MSQDQLADVAHFLDAGGRVSWSEWRGMDQQTRAYFVAAARKKRVDDAVRIGSAAHGPRGVLEVYSEIDNGEALGEALLGEAVRMEAARDAT